ncbi:HNH endonuclease signature motif containing protein [Sporolactobacillus terrae]|uniref:HNH endonuclease signature motif containing protein n=1 Tax=Sporolactobacillus terrae TaxID=269673 RepID=UPI001CBF7DD9|nr:HNH endonuclease signature motif containing protein [Sporolactobacillus terrae]UAK16115.1 HNH endonuclease [Sporolactobacillus terrae]
MEQWRMIEKDGTTFNVSNEGNIQIIDFDSKRQIRNVERFSLSGGHYGSRYLFISSEYVHRLVAEAWISKIPEGYEVHHIDGNKENNRTSNLKIVSRSEHKKLDKKSYPRKLKAPIFYIIDTDENEIVAQFYSERAMACFLYCFGKEMAGEKRQTLMKKFPKDRYEIVRSN